MFKNLFASCLILVAMTMMYASAGSARSAKKPLPPLQVRIAPVQPGITSDQIRPGDTVAFKVIAVSFMDVQEMRIDVELTDGAKLVSGDTSWSGSAAKNEEKTIILTVRAPETGKGRIKARVTIPPAGSARFSTEAQYVLGPETKPEQEHPVRKDSKGRRIIEYR